MDWKRQEEDREWCYWIGWCKKITAVEAESWIHHGEWRHWMYEHA